MIDRDKFPRKFLEMGPEDLDLTMFTIIDLSLVKIGQHVEMRIQLKRKISKELLTTFLPTILLLLITFTSMAFDKSLFGDALAVNLTIMLVMTTIFTSKIAELPSTSDTKMIDIWLIGCLLVPFTEVVLRTIIEVFENCDHCKGFKEIETRRRNERRNAWKRFGSTHCVSSDNNVDNSRGSIQSECVDVMGGTQETPAGRCWKSTWLARMELVGDFSFFISSSLSNIKIMAFVTICRFFFLQKYGFFPSLCFLHLHSTSWLQSSSSPIKFKRIQAMRRSENI